MADFSTILAIPPALLALGELIDHLRTGNGAKHQQDVEHLADSLTTIREQISNSITETEGASSELEAWKRVHHISNRLETDLSDTLPLVASNSRAEFVDKCEQPVRRRIAAELRTVNRSGASVSDLRLLVAKPDLFAHITFPERIYQEEKQWSDFLIDSCESALVCAEEGSLGELYCVLNRVYQVNINVNNYADDMILSRVTKLYADMQSLYSSLTGC